jgi:hypothetical protein
MEQFWRTFSSMLLTRQAKTSTRQFFWCLWKKWGFKIFWLLYKIFLNWEILLIAIALAVLIIRSQLDSSTRMKTVCVDIWTDVILVRKKTLLTLTGCPLKQCSLTIIVDWTPRYNQGVGEIQTQDRLEWSKDKFQNRDTLACMCLKTCSFCWLKNILGVSKETYNFTGGIEVILYCSIIKLALIRRKCELVSKKFR